MGFLRASKKTFRFPALTFSVWQERFFRHGSIPSITDWLAFPQQGVFSGM
jgi:hypothetical protein